LGSSQSLASALGMSAAQTFGCQSIDGLVGQFLGVLFLKVSAHAGRGGEGVSPIAGKSTCAAAGGGVWDTPRVILVGIEIVERAVVATGVGLVDDSFRSVAVDLHGDRGPQRTSCS
jgi:hypothetical protein